MNSLNNNFSINLIKNVNNSYKPKIIKYKYNTRFFNNNPKDNNQNKKVRNIKSEINFNKSKN